jgi:dipeptidase
MVTHNNDCEDCDVRIGVVPSVEHSGKPGDDSCPIHPCAFDFPRYVGNDRGPLYTLEHLKLEGLADWNPVETVPLGHIAQPKGRTYRYFDGTYGMMNEHQLAIGESTCGAKIAAYSVARGGEAMMEASVLTRLALQRCKTARCAVELMGHLAETHGFTGSEDPVEEGTAMFDVAGEALTVIDTREAWVMHLLADASGRSAIWAAQRVPDDHVAVVPNHFVIDRINVSDSANFLASHDIVGAAVAAGLVKSEDVEREGGADNFHFSRTFALDFHDPDGGKGERRRWRIFSLLAPSMNLSAAANGHSVADAARMSSRLPFSVRVDPDRRVGVRDVMALMRDHYEGTPFDQTKGLAAGPYGAPNRYDRSKSMQEASQGFFERSVSIHRTSYSFVAQAKEVTGDSAVGSVINGGTLWFAHHTPASSLYLPLPCSSLSLPSSFSRGSLYRLDRSSAWWAFAAVANNAERMYQPIHNYIAQRQDKLEVESQQRLEQAQQKAVQLAAAGQTKQAQQFITKFTVEHNQKVSSRSLAWALR